MAKSTLIGAMMLLPALGAVAPVSAQVGIASAVSGEPVGKPTTESERVLHIGNDMTADEVVTTHSADRVQIVFLDGSTLMVGPHSQVTIDRFVYDPARKSGEQAFRVGRGVFRYVGGAISKTSEVSIRTPSATMGIRGGIAVFSVTSTGATTASLLFGASLSMTSNGVTVTTTQPGTQISALANAAPSAPTPIPAGGLQQFDRAFQGVPQPGAAPAISGALAGSTLSQGNSGMAPAEALAAVPGTQQAQLNTTRGAAAAAPGMGQPPVVGAGPMQAASPLQGASPTNQDGPGAGTQQMAGLRQTSGPLDASSPFQASGPLQNAGPLASARPTQETGPIQGSMALAGPTSGPMPAVPTVPVQLAAALASGDPGALAQLQNLLGSPQGTTSTTLTTLVSGVSSPGNSGNASTQGGTANRPTPTSAPIVLPPVVYNNPGSSKVSQN